MTDKMTHQERLRKNAHLAGHGGHLPKNDADAGEEPVSSGVAFGYERGSDRAAALEFRLRDETSVWFPYALMGPFRYHPSEGILLTFSGQVTYLVLIRGSNLDKPLKEGAMNLTSGGIQRQRVLWVREMSETDSKQVGMNGPVIDSIEITEHETNASVKEWISINTPKFVR
jgi:hypothetical protein